MRAVPDWAGYLRFRDAFAEVIDPRRYTLDWLEGRILDGTAQLWSSGSAAVVTEIKVYPTGAADLHFLVAAGDLGEIVDVIRPEVERWARGEIGCLGALVESRDGWAKVLKPHGYQTHQIVVRKEF